MRQPHIHTKIYTAGRIRMILHRHAATHRPTLTTPKHTRRLQQIIARSHLRQVKYQFRALTENETEMIKKNGILFKSRKSGNAPVGYVHGLTFSNFPTPGISDLSQSDMCIIVSPLKIWKFAIRLCALFQTFAPRKFTQGMWELTHAQIRLRDFQIPGFFQTAILMMVLRP